MTRTPCRRRSRKVWWLDTGWSQSLQRGWWITEQSPVRCRFSRSCHSMDSILSVQNRFHKRRKGVYESSSSHHKSHKLFVRTIQWHLEKSCEVLSWNHRTSTPHRSETSGIAERAVRRVKESTSRRLVDSPHFVALCCLASSSFGSWCFAPLPVRWWCLPSPSSGTHFKAGTNLVVLFLLLRPSGLCFLRKKFLGTSSTQRRRRKAARPKVTDDTSPYAHTHFFSLCTPHVIARLAQGPDDSLCLQKSSHLWWCLSVECSFDPVSSCLLTVYCHTDATDWNQTKPESNSTLGWTIWPSGRSDSKHRLWAQVLHRCQ